MILKDIEPHIKDIVNWSIIVIGISIGLSIVSILLTEPNGSFLDNFVLSMSNFTFFIGMIFIGLTALIVERIKANKKVMTV